MKERKRKEGKKQRKKEGGKKEGKETKNERKKERKKEGKKNITFLYVYLCVAFLTMDLYWAKIRSERVW